MILQLASSRVNWLCPQGKGERAHPRLELLYLYSLISEETFHPLATFHSLEATWKMQLLLKGKKIHKGVKTRRKDHFGASLEAVYQKG